MEGGGGDDDCGKVRAKGPSQFAGIVGSLCFCFSQQHDVLLALVVLFASAASGMHMDPRSQMIGDWHYQSPIVYLNTAILLLSSVTVEFARQHIFREIDVLEEWLGLDDPAACGAPCRGWRRRWCWERCSWPGRLSPQNN